VTFDLYKETGMEPILREMERQALVRAERSGGLEQQLLGLLVHYLSSQDCGSRFLAEARRIGGAYGRQQHAAGAAMRETVESLLRVRNTFAQLAMPAPGLTQPADIAETTALHTRIDHLMDALLLGAIAAYESLRAEPTLPLATPWTAYA
jgi:hypothetical protein